MSFKPNSLIIMTALSCGIAAAGTALFLSQDSAQPIMVEQGDEIESPIITAQKNNYPLAPEAIDALINQEDKNAEHIDSMEQQQAVPILLPSSLLGSTLPLALDVNEDGELVINKKIQHLFDFYLSAMGEESLETIITRIKHSLESQLAEPALAQGIHILTGYLQYLNEVTAIKQEFEQSIDPENSGEYALEYVIQAREMVLDARANYLDSDVITAFFGQADEYEAYMLSLATINKDNNLSAVEKQNAKKTLDEAAPAWLLEQQQNANQLNRYREKYQHLQEQGATQSELQDFTQQSFEPEVADRLALLDEKRQQWQNKLDEYREQLETIITSTTYNDSDPQQQQLEIAQLREVYFTPQEIKRVSVLDGINKRSRSTTAL